MQQITTQEMRSNATAALNMVGTGNASVETTQPLLHRFFDWCALTSAKIQLHHLRKDAAALKRQIEAIPGELDRSIKSAKLLAEQEIAAATKKRDEEIRRLNARAPVVLLNKQHDLAETEHRIAALNAKVNG